MLASLKERVGKQGSLHAHHVYGVRLASQWPLPCPEGTGPSLAEIDLTVGYSALFAEVDRGAVVPPLAAGWFHYAGLADGSVYLRWSGLFEFLISASGRRIACRSLGTASREAFLTYLLGQVLSFALLKQEIEPLHATVVGVDEGAVALLGNSGYGKSSLAAAFVRAGYPLLTDDLGSKPK